MLALRVATLRAPLRPVPSVVNLVLFQGLWWLTILCVPAGLGWVGPAAVLGVLLGQLWWLKDRGCELRALLVTALPGFLLDSLLGYLGAFGFPHDTQLLGSLPLWMGALWLNFALTTRHGLAWLHGRPWLGVAFGALGGPLTYLAGVKFGALVIAAPLPLWLGALALSWGVACGVWFAAPLDRGSGVPNPR